MQYAESHAKAGDNRKICGRRPISKIRQLQFRGLRTPDQGLCPGSPGSTVPLLPSLQTSVVALDFGFRFVCGSSF